MNAPVNDFLGSYNEMYSDDTEEWRRLGAIRKTENILELSQGYIFEKIVKIGAGDGNILSLLSSKGFGKSLTAVEVSESAIRQIKKKNIPNLFEIKQVNGNELPFRDKEFNLAICSHVLEHVENPRTTLREIRRISEYQVFEIPVDFSFRVDKKVKHFLSYGHINIFNPPLFRFLLLSEEFQIIREKFAMYDAAVNRYATRNNRIKFFMTTIKVLIWKFLPPLMKIKPNTYTVLTTHKG
ncbi:MAG TPA: class I SAM-dependent methyltransferase [Cyclobacteriaceae bacterium]|nr:class I SAM-dependent methyltransferase [Cyclobacteriaceae bacterium]